MYTLKTNLILYAVITTTILVAGVSVFILNNKIADLDKRVQNPSNSSSSLTTLTNSQSYSEVASLAIQDLSQDEKDSLIYMREEEKLARDVYQTLGQTYNLQIFKNIANSEQSCSDTVLSESEITNDEVNVCQSSELIDSSATGQDIYSKNCTFLPHYSNSCWQPPKTS